MKQKEYLCGSAIGSGFFEEVAAFGLFGSSDGRSVAVWGTARITSKPEYVRKNKINENSKAKANEKYFKPSREAVSAIGDS